MKFKKIAIIGKYPSLEETKDIHNQLIQLITHLSQKNIDLVIEEKTQKQIKLNKFKSLPLNDIGKQVDLAITDCSLSSYIGTTAKGIYKIENDTTLTYNGCQPGNPARPSSFGCVHTGNFILVQRGA